MSLVPQILVTFCIHVASVVAYCVVMDITPDMQLCCVDNTRIPSMQPTDKCVVTRSSLLSIEHQHILKA